MDLLKCTAIQTSAGRNVVQNRAEAWKYLYETPDTDLLVLPEVFTVRGEVKEIQAAAEPIPGESSELLATAARKRKTWVAGGLVEQGPGRPYNTLAVYDRSGQLAARYRKTHMFDVDLEDGTSFRESAVFAAGDEPVMVNIDGWKCGLAICYDLRFPALFRRYADYGAQMILVPANFTGETGEAHWEALLRARAIENQCYIVAPDQCGAHPHNGVLCHGNSMIVDPWGEVIARADRETGFIEAELDPDRVASVRKRLPSLKHRRF